MFDNYDDYNNMTITDLLGEHVILLYGCILSTRLSWNDWWIDCDAGIS